MNVDDQKVSRRYAADLEKRRRKGSSKVLKRVFDIDDSLFDIPTERKRKIAKELGDPAFEHEITSRDLFSVAIATHLADLVKAIQALELIDHRSTGGHKPRPRSVDDRAWQILLEAGELTQIPGIVLGRACVALLNKGSKVQVDLVDTEKRLRELGNKIGKKAKKSK